MSAAVLGGAAVRRCSRCGTRHLDDTDRVRFVFSCRVCGIPFEDDELLPHDRQRCEDCAQARLPPAAPDEALAGAMEHEVRGALNASFRWVGSGPLSDYLDRIAVRVAEHVDGAPGGVRVVLFDDPALRSLALPSGLLLISLGLLRSIHDEAELAFVLGHEIAHAASRDAESRLVRLGYRAAVREEGPGRDPTPWSDAALDVVRLGYGRQRERDADARALDAVLALHYDATSVLRFLHRLELRVERGEDAVAECAAAHPPPGDRVRRIERALYLRPPTGDPARVNREVFRRAAGPTELAKAVPVPLDPDAAGAAALDAGIGRGVRRALLLGAAVAALAAGLLTLGLLLAR